jgi:hypothetical protein
VVDRKKALVVGVLTAYVLAGGLGVMVGLLFAEPPAVAARTFIGPLQGRAPASARIAVVVEGETAVGYVCSSDATFNAGFSQWFKGTVTADGLKAAADVLKVDATLRGNQLDGQVTGAEGVTLAFKATLVPATGAAGLYRAEDTHDGTDYVAGWIVDQRHDVVGACKKKRPLGPGVVLKPAQPLPPPPAAVPAADAPAAQDPNAPAVQEQVEAALQAQVDPTPPQVVQGQKVAALKALPRGQKKALPRKK